jgi:predicted RNA binding protein YcfA (HicA-like mRNA interferase family)
MKVREIIELVLRDGWELVRTTGSHRQFQHRSKKGTVTIAGKPGKDLPEGTRISILKQAGLR